MMNKQERTEKPTCTKTNRRYFLKTGAALTGVALLGNALNVSPVSAATEDPQDLKDIQMLFV